MNDIKTLHITCLSCEKSAPIRYPLVDENAQGETEVRVDCPFCGYSMMVSLERKYIKKRQHVRGFSLEDAQ